MTTPRNSAAQPRRWLPKLILLGCSLALGLGIGEGTLRLLWHNPYVEERPDHLLKLLIQHPNTDHWVDRSAFDQKVSRVRFRSDARSYLLPATVHADPEVTVTFLGGSTTACNAVREDARFSGLVGRLLTERGIRTNGLNAARSSGTLHDSLNVLLNHVVLDQPDVVVVMHATNDIAVLTRTAGYGSRMGAPVQLRDMLKWLAQMASSQSYVAGLIRQTQLAGSRLQRPGFAEMEWKNHPSRMPVATTRFEQRLRSFVQIARSFGIVPVLMTQPLSASRNALTPEWTELGNQDRFNHVIREVARHEEAILIDLVQHLQENVPGWNEPMKLFYDGMHVNDEGSRVYATHIANRLYPVVREIAAQRNADPPQVAVSAPPRGQL